MLGALADLAVRVNGRVVGDGSVAIERIAAVDDAQPGTLTFATSDSYLATACDGMAAAVLVDESLATSGARKPLLVVANTREALARLLEMMRPPRPRGPFRHPTATVAPTARVAEDAYLDAHSYVGDGATVGARSVLGHGAHVGEDVRIGEDVWLKPQSTVLDGCSVGDRCVLHPGSVVGSDGFGWAFSDGRAQRIPQVGNAVIEEDVEVGANSCVDRAQTGSTVIGAGTKIDNLVQIGHNCRIGKNCVIAGLTGLAGSTIVGDAVRVGGQTGFKGHVTVGSNATIAGQSAIWNDVPDGAMVSGRPAHDHRDELRQQVMIRKLPKLFDRVEALERTSSHHR
jgi:UDP-3-O-[3-hydroxymyristoyl] glucosamine N-acyltransferase